MSTSISQNTIQLILKIGLAIENYPGHRNTDMRIKSRPAMNYNYHNAIYYMELMSVKGNFIPFQ